MSTSSSDSERVQLTSLELNDRLAVVGDLVVDDDLHVKNILVHDPLDGLEVAPWASAGVPQSEVHETHRCCWC